MENKDLSRKQPSDSPVSGNDRLSANQPEGVYVENDSEYAVRDHSPADHAAAETSHRSNRVEGNTEGIELNRAAFEEGDPLDAIGFAPNDNDDLLPDTDSSDASLAFGDLSAQPIEEDKDAPKIVRKKVIRREGGATIKGISAVLVYLLIIICMGVLSGLAIVSVANDIFAFTKDDTVYELTIDNADMSLGELADYLHEEGIIRYPAIFRLYVGLKEEEGITLHKGTFSISPSYNYDKILTCLDPPPVREEINITFSEGLTIDDIIDIFVENGIGTRAGFVDVIENYDFEYWFLEDLETTEERFYRLEGYLYPDTYRFYSDSSEAAALIKMLNNFERKVPDTYRARCEELGITLDEAVILASMIEAECARINDLEFVSAVFHNRLNSASFDGLLGSDATLQYYFRHTEGERHPNLTESDLQVESPYNSRVYKGLPPGPICNPSLNALMAAVYPNTECGYYYFVAQSNGYNLYAKTLAEHNQNVAQVRKESEDN